MTCSSFLVLLLCTTRRFKQKRRWWSRLSIECEIPEFLSIFTVSSLFKNKLFCHVCAFMHCFTRWPKRKPMFFTKCFWFPDHLINYKVLESWKLIHSFRYSFRQQWLKWHHQSDPVSDIQYCCSRCSLCPYLSV